jgi:hypothetical protein
MGPKVKLSCVRNSKCQPARFIFRGTLVISQPIAGEGVPLISSRRNMYYDAAALGVFLAAPLLFETSFLASFPEL